jgi:hypothetical protein
VSIVCVNFQVQKIIQDSLKWNFTLLKEVKTYSLVQINCAGVNLFVALREGGMEKLQMQFLCARLHLKTCWRQMWMMMIVNNDEHLPTLNWRKTSSANRLTSWQPRKHFALENNRTFVDETKSFPETSTEDYPNRVAFTHGTFNIFSIWTSSLSVHKKIRSVEWRKGDISVTEMESILKYILIDFYNFKNKLIHLETLMFSNMHT